MRLLKVVLEIEVSDISPKDRADIADDMECSIQDLPMLSHTKAIEAASALEGISGEHLNDMLFEGSDVYVKYDYVNLISAEWLDHGE